MTLNEQRALAKTCRGMENHWCLVVQDYRERARPAGCLPQDMMGDFTVREYQPFVYLENRSGMDGLHPVIWFRFGRAAVECSQAIQDRPDALEALCKEYDRPCWIAGSYIRKIRWLVPR